MYKMVIYEFMIHSYFNTIICTFFYVKKKKIYLRLNISTLKLYIIYIIYNMVYQIIDLI